MPPSPPLASQAADSLLPPRRGLLAAWVMPSWVPEFLFTGVTVLFRLWTIVLWDMADLQFDVIWWWQVTCHVCQEPLPVALIAALVRPFPVWKAFPSSCGRCSLIVAVLSLKVKSCVFSSGSSSAHRHQNYLYISCRTLVFVPLGAVYPNCVTFHLCAFAVLLILSFPCNHRALCGRGVCVMKAFFLPYPLARGARWHFSPCCLVTPAVAVMMVSPVRLFAPKMPFPPSFRHAWQFCLACPDTALY